MSHELLYELTYILYYNFQHFKILIPIPKSSEIWCSSQWRMLLATKLPTKRCLNNKKMLSHVIRTSEVRSLWRWFQWLNSVRILSGRLYMLLIFHSLFYIAAPNITSHRQHPKEEDQALSLIQKVAWHVTMPKPITSKGNRFYHADLD